jgi:hypothetical protein
MRLTIPVLSALLFLAGCDTARPPPDRDALARSTMTEPAAAPDSTLASCLVAIGDPREEPAHDALAYACAMRAAPSDDAAAMADLHLRRLAELSLQNDGRGFRDRQLAPGITLAGSGLPPGHYDFADRYGVTGGAAPGVLPGRGVAMVRFRPNPGGDAANYPPEGLFVPVALTADVETGPDGAFTVRLRTVEGGALSAEGWADATGQAYLRLLERTRLNQESARGFRDPSKLRVHGNGIYLIEPYDPDRIPLLMIHGLRSNPSIWRDLTLAVMDNPDLHARFQVWHAFYPTGLPPFYIAAKARERLRGLVARLDPSGTDMAHRHIAVIGHSMGGIVTRSLVTNDAGALWSRTFTVPPQSLPVGEKRRQDFIDILTLDHEPQIGFVGFLNTPHRGSGSAEGLIGRIAASMVMLPSSFRTIFTDDPNYLAYTTPEMREFLMDGGTTSVQALSPRHPLLRELAELPLAPGVTAVSVIGVRRGAACAAMPGCNATDGVVSYDSARLPQGKELVIQSGHGGYAAPEAIRFLMTELRSWSDGL